MSVTGMQSVLTLLRVTSAVARQATIKALKRNALKVRANTEDSLHTLPLTTGTILCLIFVLPKFQYATIPND